MSNKPGLRILLDDVPITPWALIEEAQAKGDVGDGSGLWTTSAAARFLRARGHTVEDNPDFKPGGAGC